MQPLLAWYASSRWRSLLCRWIKLGGRFSFLYQVCLSPTVVQGKILERCRNGNFSCAGLGQGVAKVSFL